MAWSSMDMGIHIESVNILVDHLHILSMEKATGKNFQAFLLAFNREWSTRTEVWSQHSIAK